MAYLSDASKQALNQAVVTVELESSAELVIALRPDSVPALVPGGIAACLSGLLGLAFLLFSPWPFSHGAMLIDTLLVGLVGFTLCRRWAGLRRALTPGSLSRELVLRAAKAEFLERGVAETTGRSGILVYVSQVERTACVVADRGVLGSVNAEAWQRVVERIERAARSSTDGLLLAEAITSLAPVLKECLPRQADDVNELEDAL
jgi:putative membrane protein